MFKEDCGDNKWSIEANLDEGCVIVSLNHHPNYGTIKLFDIVGDDLERLTKMFWAAHYAFQKKRGTPESEVFVEKCGFKKWFISVDLTEPALKVGFNRWPNVGEVALHDIEDNDLERLAKMFQAADYSTGPSSEDQTKR